MCISKIVNVKSLDAVIAEMRAECEKDIERSKKYAEESLAENIKLVETTRCAALLLEGAGIETGWQEYSTTKWLHLDLGFFSHSKAGNKRLADKVRAIRVALGCKLTQQDKGIENAKKRLVYVKLAAADFPGVRIVFTRKLPKGAKCRIVTQRSTYTSLVCDLEAAG